MSITSQQRQFIRSRAGGCCEYYRVSEEDRLARFQIDHVIPRKHGGSDDTANLCLACLKCNSFKDPNAAALDPAAGEATKLYNPRQQEWAEQFRINPDATLTGLKPGRTRNNRRAAYQRVESGPAAAHGNGYRCVSMRIVAAA